MSVTVKFFASLKETVGQSEVVLEPSQGELAVELWARASNIELPVNTLVAINMEYGNMASEINDGDEVAFFPPVTGG